MTTFNRRLGRGSVFVLIGATAITLTALQASINAPTTAFRGCLKEATVKATSEKIAPDAIDTYLRNACSVQMQSLKSAVIAFRIKNGMSRKAAADDAEMTADDYVATPSDNYKFMATLNAPAQAQQAKQPAQAPAQGSAQASAAPPAGANQQQPKP